MRNKSLVHAVFAFLILNFYSGINASAQYFGRNKVLYQNFDFRVLQTPHFEIYHYLDNKAARDRLVKWTEPSRRKIPLSFIITMLISSKPVLLTVPLA